jgi:hypothetical protein
MDAFVCGILDSLRSLRETKYNVDYGFLLRQDDILEWERKANEEAQRMRRTRELVN